MAVIRKIAGTFAPRHTPRTMLTSVQPPDGQKTQKTHRRLNITHHLSNHLVDGPAVWIQSPAGTEANVLTFSVLTGAETSEAGFRPPILPLVTSLNVRSRLGDLGLGLVRVPILVD